MRPASGAHDAVAGHHAVVAAGKQNLVVILEEILRTVPAAAQREVEDVVGMRIVADIHPHACVGRFALTQHGHDGVVGGHHMRGPHLVRHRRTLYLLLIATDEEKPHFVSEQRPNGFRGLYQVVSQKIFADNGPLETKHLGQSYPGEFTLMDLINMTAHVSLKSLITAKGVPDSPELLEMDPYLHRIEKYESHLKKMGDLFEQGKDRAIVLASIQSLYLSISIELLTVDCGPLLGISAATATQWNLRSSLSFTAVESIPACRGERPLDLDRTPLSAARCSDVPIVQSSSNLS